MRINSTLSTALALSPKLKAFERKAECEQQQLEQLGQWAYRFSPQVCLHSASGDASLILVEVGSVIRMNQGLSNILNAVADGLNEQAYSFTMGVAHTPKAAIVLARGSQLLSRPVPMQTSPDEVSCISALRQLPLELLEYDTRHISSLKKTGLETIGQVLDLPMQALARRFGKGFQLYLEQLSGKRPDPQQCIEPRMHFASQLFFIEPVENAMQLVFPMQRLLDELCQFLYARQLQCNHFVWRMYQGSSLARSKGKHCQLDIQLGQAQVSKSNFLNLTRIRLEKLLLQQGVHTLQLEAKNFVKASGHSQQLFDALGGLANREPLDTLFDKLQTRLGQDMVYCIDCEQEHLPERASVRALVDTSARYRKPAITDKEKIKGQASALRRPAWLLRQAVRIQQRQGAMYWGGKLSLLQGPERIETAWWESPEQRDYYIAQHENGGLYWVYKDLARNSWFVQGLFS